VSLIAAVDRAFLVKRVARVSPAELEAILSGIQFVLGHEG
jgi:hypothetical protein